MSFDVSDSIQTRFARQKAFGPFLEGDIFDTESICSQFTANSSRSVRKLIQRRHCLCNGFMARLQIDCRINVKNPQTNWKLLLSCALFFREGDRLGETFFDCYKSFRSGSKTLSIWQKNSLWEHRFILVAWYAVYSIENSLSWELFNQNFLVEEWHSLCFGKQNLNQLHLWLAIMHFACASNSNLLVTLQQRLELSFVAAILVECIKM